MVQDDHSVGQRLKKLRDLAGMTQAEVAQQMTDEGVESIYPQTITRIENGTRSLKWAEAEALARVIGFELEELSGEAESTLTKDRLAQTVIANLVRQRNELGKLALQIEMIEHNLRELASGDLSPAVAMKARRALGG